MQSSAVKKIEKPAKVDLRSIAEDLYGTLAKEGLARNQILSVTGHLISMVTQTIRQECQSEDE
jgi:hypothetical protein